MLGASAHYLLGKPVPDPRMAQGDTGSNWHSSLVPTSEISASGILPDTPEEA